MCLERLLCAPLLALLNGLQHLAAAGCHLHAQDNRRLTHGAVSSAKLLMCREYISVLLGLATPTQKPNIIQPLIGQVSNSRKIKVPNTESTM